MILQYERPIELYPKQADFVQDRARHCFVEAGTKAGKTVGMIVWINEQCLFGKRHQNFWWVAPNAGTAKIAFERLYNEYIPSKHRKFYKKNETERSITYPNGTKIWFKGADRPDSLYGEDVYAVVIDEASRVKENSYIAVLSTTTATNAPIRYIGNLKGKKNWFYRECQAAKQVLLSYGSINGYHGYHKLTSLDNPKNDPETIMAMKDKMTIDQWNELYMAEASEDGSNPFGDENVAACAIETENKHGIIKEYAKNSLFYGIDVGSVIDYTVIIGLDKNGFVCHFERFKDDWPIIQERVINAVGGAFARIDDTGVGKSAVEEIKSTYKCPNLKGFTFSAKGRYTKQDLMQELGMALASKKLRYPKGSMIHNELDTFEYEHTHWGIKYSAPSGLHDDCVMALALANKCKKDMGYL